MLANQHYHLIPNGGMVSAYGMFVMLGVVVSLVFWLRKAKTDPENKSYKPYVPTHQEWSARKLCFITFLPCVLWIFMGLLVKTQSAGAWTLAIFMLYVVPVVALGLAVSTAVHFMRVKQSDMLEGIGYMILWLLAHAALLFIGYIACVAINAGSY